MNVGIVCDYLEERWPSMDLTAEMLLRGLDQIGDVRATRICPPMAPRFSALPLIGKHKAARTADRFVNRFLEYPRYLNAHSALDIFHIVDHSYANLVHALPPDRTVVTCHDLDAFRSILEPRQEPRPRCYRAVMQRILTGLRKAARVVCDSNFTRDSLVRYGVLAPERLDVAPLGAHPSCSPHPDPPADQQAARMLGEPDPSSPEILHVGSTIARKRIDLLLHLFAKVIEEFPRARLVRVGGPFTVDQEELVRRLNLADAIQVLPHLSRPVLAAVYRRAAVVVLPSEREGFGLPVAEAMACGCTVVASDLAVLREIGGNAAVYCRPEAIPDWVERVTDLLHDRISDPDASQRRFHANIEQVARFTWTAYAERMALIYRHLCS